MTSWVMQWFWNHCISITAIIFLLLIIALFVYILIDGKD